MGKLRRIYKDEENADHTIIHLMVNSNCTNRCKDCCNNQYNLDKVPVATVEELQNAKVVLLTGGEPFLLADIHDFVKSLRWQYQNIEKLYIYTSGYAMYKTRDKWLCYGDFGLYVDGINFSPKCNGDEKAIKKLFDDTDASLFLLHNMSNRIILMDYEGKTTDDDEFIQSLNCSDVSLSAKFSIENRAFQKKFQPNGGVWRRLPIFLDKKSLY